MLVVDPASGRSARYFATEEEYLAWDIVDSRDPVGFDTEFYGIDITWQSALLSRVHVFSLAYLTGRMHPRGYHRAEGATFPAEALEWPSIRRLLTGRKNLLVAHNAPVDIHATYATSGYSPVVTNTLSLARWMYPTRVDQGGYGLKALMGDLLGREPLGSFKDLFSEEDLVETVREVKRCACGKDKCRKRLLPEHQKLREAVVSYKSRGRKPVPIETISPGHDLWEVLVVYAAEDAEAAVELYDLMQRKDKR